MSRKKKKAPPFVMIRKDLLEDKEFRKLTSGAKVLYVYLRAKFNPKKNGELDEVVLTYEEMKGVLESKAMCRAIRELMKGGWIKRTKKGGMFGGWSAYKFAGEFKHFYYKGYKV